MTQIGYAISSEEHAPNDILRHAQSAEEVGFPFALISDHFHPWVDKQGHSPFVWSVLGGIAHVTQRLQVGTGVTCPMIRIHPAIIAQATATVAAMMPGRFFLGVGTGENLNEHILGDRWPPHDVRSEMLEEAVAVMRLLWQGGQQTHRGKHYTVENARLYTLLEEPPQIMVAASGSRAAELAGRIGDGLINTAPDAEVRQQFEQAGGAGKPRYAQMTVCWAANVAQARRTALEIWPNGGLKGELSQELPTPKHFEQAAQLVTEEMVAEEVVCGPDPEQHIAKIQAYVDAGYDHIYVHQVGPDQDGFFDFYRREILPKFH
ncbi:MAG: Dehydrogenase [uncultured Chloroflexia bacterium]|uniref:Dehydrogenase n=1 Tax=uncultured Chloroflexia bacterium TaxID=1672391 RepID=A0A6J4IDT1_9CHLR|nr:MAG: Dehydrogenase [uncultured Chloroflexia bacterium]